MLPDIVCHVKAARSLSGSLRPVGVSAARDARRAMVRGVPLARCYLGRATASAKRSTSAIVYSRRSRGGWRQGWAATDSRRAVAAAQPFAGPQYSHQGDEQLAGSIAFRHCSA